MSVKYAKTQRELAEALGIGQKNVAYHTRNGGPGKTGRGYCVGTWKKFLATKGIRSATIDAIREGNQSEPSTEPQAGDHLSNQDHAELKRLKELETVRKIQIDNLTKAGKLVRVNWHEEQMAAMAGEMQAELKTMVRTLPPEIAGLSTVEAQKVLERAVNGIIAKIAKGTK